MKNHERLLLRYQRKIMISKKMISLSALRVAIFALIWVETFPLTKTLIRIKRQQKCNLQPLVSSEICRKCQL
ncbi:hypothetical protein DPMN_190484 [Dreissena polymorpha]|uniref:Uncharacterized protein n=1 Tax=Dreissena polymorpha TaxID=45954 RepID=A0A9D4IBS7_DREPO|nr:hypothetical protein DPMN_190484 [Dreissena polymorpha]